MKLRRRRYLSLLGIMLVCLSIASCQQDSIELNVGVLYHTNTVAGNSLRNAMDMVDAELQAQTSFNFHGQNYHIQFIGREIGETQETALAAFHQLVRDVKLTALVGPTSSNQAIPIARVAEAMHLPMISPSSTHPETTADKHYVFRAVFTDETQTRALVQFAIKTLQAKRIGILYDISNAYSKNVAERLRNEFVERYQIAVIEEKYLAGEDNFMPSLTRLKQQQVNLLFLPNFEMDVNHQLEQLQKLQWPVTLLGSDSWYPDELSRHDWPNPMYYSHQWHKSIGAVNPVGKIFIEAYQQRFQRQPTIIAALSYDAIHLLLAGLEKAGPKPEQLSAAMASLQDYQGVTGTFSFNGKGTPQKPVYIFNIKDHRVRLVEEVHDE